MGKKIETIQDLFLDENGKIRDKEEILKDVETIVDGIESYENMDKMYIESFLPEDSLICDPDEVIISHSFLSREIYIVGEINAEMGVAIPNQIRFWNKADDADGIPVEERAPIKVYIDTPGGDMSATFAMIDSIKNSKTPVYTITTGEGCSGGFFVGICGHKRFGYKHSSYLFHEGSCSFGADAHKYGQHYKFYAKRLNQIKDITLENTKFTEKFYNIHKKDDLWLTADEALKFGVIDEIVNGGTTDAE